jgi:hypothetical protein
MESLELLIFYRVVAYGRAPKELLPGVKFIGYSGLAVTSKGTIT